MEENQDLENLLGRIYQLVNYKGLNLEDLTKIQAFCETEKQRIISGNLLEYINKNKWERGIVYEQTDTGRIYPESAIPMIWEYVDLNNLNDKYRKRLEITKEVADEIFFNVSEVNIFLGENDEGLIFMCGIADGTNLNYYIVSNTLRKQPISLEEFDNYRNGYNGGVGKILNQYIQGHFNASALNTRKFTVSNILYKELVNQSSGCSNLVISFYPAIHIKNYITTISYGGVNFQVDYKNRLTFVMLLEYYSGSTRNELPGAGVFDRNGLCPPPDNSNC